MKKLLLTIAMGMLMLSLPVIASAANQGFDEYSGYTADVTVHGFTLYSTAKGANAGIKPFAVTYKATGTAKNTWGYFKTGAGHQLFLRINLNATTTMFAVAYAPIAPKGGNTMLVNTYWEIYNDTGAIPTSFVGDISAPASAGLTATQVALTGSSDMTIHRSPNTGAMVLYMSNPAASYSQTFEYTSSGSPATWNQTGLIDTWMVSRVGISPIKLSIQPDTAGANFLPWWQ